MMTAAVMAEAPTREHSATFHRWEDAELAALAKYTHERLGILDRLSAEMADDDLADAAGAIWREFARDRGRGGRVGPDRAGEVARLGAGVVAHLAHHLPGVDLVAAVRLMWGDTPRHSVFNREAGRTGVVAWMPEAGAVHIFYDRDAAHPVCYGLSVTAEATTVLDEAGNALASVGAGS
ncbi:MAG: hypothetical protein LBG60_10780 [Bifidobacteriaceae bacterium]|jgi:hypothetical protein|nr:hypothetical protein [Bifidobacteriaceae bacterium]